GGNKDNRCYAWSCSCLVPLLPSTLDGTSACSCSGLSYLHTFLSDLRRSAPRGDSGKCRKWQLLLPPGPVHVCAGWLGPVAQRCCVSASRRGALMAPKVRPKSRRHVPPKTAFYE